MFVAPDLGLTGLVGALEAAAAAVAASLDPDAVPGSEATALYERLDRVGRVVGGARTVLARRVAEAGAWRGTQHQSAAEHLAALGGTSIGTARDELATSAALPNLPDVRTGMLTGELSGAQGAVIADAGRHAPDAAPALVAAAKRSNLQDLRNQAGRAKAAADASAAARHARIHRERRCSRSTRSDGTWALSAQGTPEDGALIAAMLDREVDRIYRSTNGTAERSSRDAMAFDALVAIARRHGQVAGPAEEPKDNPRFLAILRADAAALQRGALEADEVCEIAGVGPVPVGTARRLLGDSVLKLVITRGIDVLNVTHLGRGATAAQRIALTWTSPECTVEGCTRSHVERDHRVDWATTRHTRLDELDHLCDHHHDQKSRAGWSLVMGAGKRAFVPPGHPDHPGSEPPGRSRSGPTTDPPGDATPRRTQAQIAQAAIRALTTDRPTQLALG